MVGRLLEFKLRIDNCMQKSFENNSEYNGVVRKAWEYFLNERQNKPAELIAKFIDHQLRTGARGISEQELEDSLDRVMDIFRYIHGKDVFQAFYKKDLAKVRLLTCIFCFNRTFTFFLWFFWFCFSYPCTICLIFF